MGPMNKTPALGQIMAWHRPNDKPLFETMVVKFIDAYMRHSTSMSHRLKCINLCKMPSLAIRRNKIQFDTVYWIVHHGVL